MSLNDVRQAYEQNYNEMLGIITKMGGDGKIKFHRKMQTPLYKKLKSLQRREHQLDVIENRMRSQQMMSYA